MEFLLQAANELAINHHSQYDSSHDFQHVLRVKNLSISLALAVEESNSVDLEVITFAALFHDLLDSKYLPLNGKNMKAFDYLSDFWNTNDKEGVIFSLERRRLVEKIMENVSYSKEILRIKAGDETEWHQACIELHCVQDADKLDAIGAIGILRCAAFSGAKSIPLLSSPKETNSQSSAIDHFHEKLLNLEGMMRTKKGRELAKRRTAFMREFLLENELEVVEQSERF